jgi:hypothetical protein
MLRQLLLLANPGAIHALAKRRDFEELGRLLAEQDAAERELRRASKGRRAALGHPDYPSNP